jgi:hypothetical protein
MESSNGMKLIELINYAGNDFYAPVVLFIATNVYMMKLGHYGSSGVSLGL